MKATDLIHGGYCLLGKSKEVVKFYALNGHFYTLDNRCIGQAYENAESGQISCLVQGSVWLEVDPIPLTAEILEKNGVKDSGALSYEFYDGYHVFLYAEKRTVHAGALWFVHELQHALRLCGLHDLADNFKI